MSEFEKCCYQDPYVSERISLVLPKIELTVVCQMCFTRATLWFDSKNKIDGYKHMQNLWKGVHDLTKNQGSPMVALDILELEDTYMLNAMKPKLASK